MPDSNKRNVVLTGISADIVFAARQDVAKLEKEVKDIVEQRESGLLTSDEMAKAVILKCHDILAQCTLVGGAAI